MYSRIDLLSEVIENKVNVLSDQCKNFEVLQDNIKFLKMEMKTKNEIINNLLDTQFAIVESMSLAKQQNSQVALQSRAQNIFGDTIYLCYCKFRLVISIKPATGTELQEIIYREFKSKRH